MSEEEELLKNAKIYSVEQKNIRPLDVIIVKFSQRLSEVEAGKIKKIIQDYFPNNKCIVLGEGAEILIARVENDPTN